MVGKTSFKPTKITIMAYNNVAGRSMPPMFVVKGKNFLGEHWFNSVFSKHCGTHRLQLLILDGLSSHKSSAILEHAIEEQIYNLALPPQTTHDLQPLDKSVYELSSRAYNLTCAEFLQEKFFTPSEQVDFSSFYKSGMDSLTSENITSGFSACRMYPFNPSVIVERAFEPSTLLISLWLHLKQMLVHH